MTEAHEFKLEKRGDEWCAVSEDGSRSFGCYPTEEEARERLRQVEAAAAAGNDLQEFEVTTAEDAAAFGWAQYRTQPTDNHLHWLDPSSAVTEPPITLTMPQGDRQGHRHEIIRDEEGRVTGVGEAEGHTHDLDTEHMAEVDERMSSYLEESGATDFAATRTVEGESFPASDWAYVPDPEKPSTWKLRLTGTPGGAPDAGIVGAAVAAIGKGFRGRRVQIPSPDRPKVLRKVRAAWKKANPNKSEDDMPSILKGKTFEQRDFGKQEDDELYEIRDVEVFAAGEWNDEKYTNKDLDSMVEAFDKVGYQVPLKLGHRDEAGERAYGWVRNLRREGAKLLADFADLSKEVYDWIQEHRYDHVSAEIFHNLKRGKDKFRRALKAVALLGAETPGVAGLQPLRTATFDGVRGELHVIPLGTQRGSDNMPKDTTNPKPEELEEDDGDATVKELQAKLEAAEQLTARVKDLEAENNKLREHAPKKGDEAFRVQELTERTEQLERALAETKDQARRREIKQKVEGFRIPALRPHFEALYDLATQVHDDLETVKFTVFDGSKKRETDVSPVDVIDNLMERLDRGTKFFFEEKTLSHDLARDDEAVSDDPSEQLRSAALKIQRDKGCSFTEAVKLARAEHPQLRVAYDAGRE